MVERTRSAAPAVHSGPDASEDALATRMEQHAGSIDQLLQLAGITALTKPDDLASFHASAAEALVTARCQMLTWATSLRRLAASRGGSED